MNKVELVWLTDREWIKIITDVCGVDVMVKYLHNMEKQEVELDWTIVPSPCSCFDISLTKEGIIYWDKISQDVLKSVWVNKDNYLTYVQKAVNVSEEEFSKRNPTINTTKAVNQSLTIDELIDKLITTDMWSKTIKVMSIMSSVDEKEIISQLKSQAKLDKNGYERLTKLLEISKSI